MASVSGVILAVLWLACLRCTHADNTMLEVFTSLDAVKLQLIDLETYVDGEVTQLKRENSQLLAMIQQRQHYHDGPMFAFSAYVTAGGRKNYAVGDTIVFDGIITNEGTMYTPSAGTFDCPLNGWYYFSLTLKSDSLKFAAANIVHAGRVVATVQTETGYDKSTNSALIECTAGDRVQVNAFDTTDLYSVDATAHCTFSGFLASQKV